MTATSERVGRYQLLEPIGLGPCGTVARAKVFGVAGFERQFAVKRFHPELTITSSLASALSSAARAYGSLEHPRIARMSEFGVAQGTTFTAVEHVAGLDAARLGAEARLAGATLAAGGALALVSQAARAVGYAHGRGLTHLGLAPTNVIVTADGDVKITDFGILAAGLPQRPIDVARLAQRIQYLAPEQVANEATSAATDVFALGVIAYELVTGQRTFRGETPQQVAQSIMSGPPAEPPLPRPIVRVLHRCLARSPFERFPDARALADALDAALRVAPVPGTRKDIGAQVKQTMDRLAEMSANEMSGMVALHVGTGPIPRSVRSEIATLGRADLDELGNDPVPTTDFVRPDVPVPGPSPLVSPASTLQEMPKPMTTMAGVAPPPIPVPQGIGGIPGREGLATTSPQTTLLGISRPNASNVPKIPPLGPRPQIQPIPAIPRIPMAPPTTPADTPTGMDHHLKGRIEIDPPPGFDPPVMDVSMVELFDEEGPIRHRDAPPVPASVTPRAPSVDDDAMTRPGTDLTIPREEVPRDQIATQEMARGFVEKLREEASRSSDGESVQMEVVQPPPDDDIDPGASAAANASFAQALHEASGVFARPVPPLGLAHVAPASELRNPFAAPSDTPPHADPMFSPIPTPTPDPTEPLEPPPSSSAAWTAPAPVSQPAIRVSSPHPQPNAEIPSLQPPPVPANAGSVATKAPSNAPWIVVALLGLGAVGVGGYFVYTKVVLDDEPAQKPVATKGDASVKTTPDATQVAIAVDAAGAAVSSDAAAAASADAALAVDAAQLAAVDAAAPPADATQVAAVVDAAGPVPAIDAGAITPTGPSDQLSITSTPPGAHVYLDGADVGQTPISLPAANDRHTIALLLPGYEMYIAEVDGKGTFAIPLVEVTPSGGPAGIKVLRCKDKDRYYVFVDGKPTGQLCPTERIEVDLGPHTVEVYDAVSESRKKWDIVVKDTRLSHRVKIE
ncbi:MAG: protein kinase domain-containing protein [Kofleriaceae bacterium]